MGQVELFFKINGGELVPKGVFSSKEDAMKEINRFTREESAIKSHYLRLIELDENTLQVDYGAYNAFFYIKGDRLSV